jgi:hypothetical protein
MPCIFVQSVNGVPWGASPACLEDFLGRRVWRMTID